MTIITYAYFGNNLVWFFSITFNIYYDLFSLTVTIWEIKWHEMKYEPCCFSRDMHHESVRQERRAEETCLLLEQWHEKNYLSRVAVNDKKREKKYIKKGLRRVLFTSRYTVWKKKSPCWIFSLSSLFVIHKDICKWQSSPGEYLGNICTQLIEG